MDQRYFIMDEEDAFRIDQCLQHFVEATGVIVALLMSRDGHLLCRQGTEQDLPVDSLCALAVGTFASSEALAHLAGEETFNSIFHQGVHCNVYISLVGKDHLLLTLFNYRASAPLVRLQAKIAAEVIINIFDRAAARANTSRTEPQFQVK